MRRFNKYKAKVAFHGTGLFDSKGERDFYQELLLLQRAGKIGEIERQSRVYLSAAKIVSIVDFFCFDVESQEWVYKEFKGIETPVWRIKRRLWMHYGPGKLEVWKRRKNVFFLNEVIEPKQCQECCAKCGETLGLEKLETKEKQK